MDGTGAYRFVAFQHDDRVEMTRNDQAWSGAPAWNQVTVRFIPNNAARLAALLSGDVDAIEGVPASDIASVRQNPEFVFAQKTSARLVYFYVDSGREDTPQVSAKDGGTTGIRWRMRGCVAPCHLPSIAPRSRGR